MALKNLFDMVKADRYTADGREALIKAQEAETEDKVYQIGEISQKTGLQKTANGWVKPKNGKQPGAKEGAAGKTSRVSKEEAIRKDLGLTEGEDMSRFSDEQIEKMYAKTQQTPEQQKADFDKSKIGQAVNKGRQEFAAEKTRQKELASKTNAIGLPKGNKPALSQTDGKGNKVEIKITESKGGGFYVDKYVNGKKVGINNANTRESAEAKAKSMMEQHMADPDYRAESNPAAQEVKLGGGADTYYFEDPDNMSNEDKVFKSLGIELAETFGDHDGEPGNTETWANGWLDNIMDNGGLGIKSKKTRQPAAPVPADEVMRIVEENPARWDRIIGNAKKFYEGKGRSTDFESDEFYPIKLVGGKTKPSAQYYAEGKRNEKNNPLTGKYVTQRQNTSKDAAPRVLTGDTKIRVRKA